MADVMTLFREPANVGPLDEADPGVVRGEAGRLAENRLIRLWVNQAGGNITDAAFQAFGPPSLVAAGSWLTTQLRGRNLDNLNGLDASAIAEALALQGTDVAMALLAEDALKAALSALTSK